jgi:hypothetical protein
VPDTPTFLSICPVCQNQIDVTELEPFTKLACPHCGQLVRVRRNFDHFRIIKQIGEGGMSRVFEAEDETLGRRVALKILNRTFSRDAARVAQFRQEALLTARLTHLNVIKLFTTGEDHGYFYIAMELVGGGSLEHRIKSLGRLPEQEVLRIGLEVAEGLRAAHKDGLIHRDVKPANILFTDTGTAKVVDFGLALFADSQRDEGGEIWATPYYVAPEKVIHNDEDHRSDIFSLGATLYHALTGQPPHRANTNSITELCRIKSKPVSLEDSGLRFSQRTVAVVNRLMALDPAARPQTYDAVVEELRVAERMRGLRGGWLASKRRRAAAVSAAVLIGAFVIGWLARSTGERAATSTRSAAAQRGVLTGGGVTVTGAGSETVGDRFRQARELLMRGELAAAREMFEVLLDAGMRQPAASWARYHAAVCAALAGDEAGFQLHSEALGGQAEAGAPAFFDRLVRLLQKSDSKREAKVAGFARDNEEAMGYLMLGLREWLFGDLRAGARMLRFFFDSMPVLVASLPGNGGSSSIEWIPPYAEAMNRMLRPALDALAWAEQLTPGASVEEMERELARAAQLRRQLRRPAALMEALEQAATPVRRELAKARLEESQREMAVQNDKRRRELAQLEDLDDLLPGLVHGHDFTKACLLLRDLRFETPEATAALEARVYLYQGAADFMIQLQEDLRRNPWQGTIQRVQATPISGTIVAMTPEALTLEIDQGRITVPTGVVAAETLLEAAEFYALEVTDSTDYYRRMELKALFARASDLRSLASVIAAGLMEEHRGFRARWLKLL